MSVVYNNPKDLAQIERLATKDLTNLCYRLMTRYVLFSGDTQRIHLRENVTIGDDYIAYLAVYAEYQYRGMRRDGSRKVKNYTTPGTGPYWAERMLSVERENILKRMRDKYGK